MALLVYAAFHLHQVGLPDFLKNYLVDQLAAQGLIVDFSRMRLELGQGLVAENVMARLPGTPGSQFAYFQSVTLKFDWQPVRSGELPRIHKLILSGGEASVPVEGNPGEPSALMRFSGLQGDLEFLGPDYWQLVGLSGRMNNLHFEAMGTTHLPDRLFQSSPARVSGSPRVVKSPALALTLHNFEQMQFRAAPRMDLAFAVDGAALDQSIVQIRFSTAGARTPHGEFEGIRLSFNLQPSQRYAPWLQVSIRLQSDATRTRWGTLASLNWKGDMLLPTNQAPVFLDWQLNAQSVTSGGTSLDVVSARGTTTLTNEHTFLRGSGFPSVVPPEIEKDPGYLTRLAIQTADFSSQWLVATNVALETVLWNATNQWIPAAADWNLRVGRTLSPEVRADRWALRGRLFSLPPDRRPVLESFWTHLVPWQFQFELAATNVAGAPPYSARQVTLAADWNAPQLRITNLTVELPAGWLQATGAVDAATRQAQVGLDGNFLLRGLEPFLPADLWSQVTRQEVSPDNRLVLDLTARGELPPWDNPFTNWPAHLGTNVILAAALRGTNLAGAGVVLDGLEVRFKADATHLDLETLQVAKAPGELNLRGQLDRGNGQFEVQVDSSLNPLDFRPLIQGDGVRRQLDLMTFNQPPVIAAAASGKLEQWDELSFRASVALTNAIYRREPVSELRTSVSYTNLAAVFTGTEVRLGTNSARAPWMRFDARTQLLHITNAIARLDLGSLARIIGPKTAKILGRYQFPEPPEVRVTGFIPVDADADADVLFQARAPQFEWWYFRFTNLIATVGWQGDQLTITNVAAGLYDGLMSATIGVDFTDRNNTKFQADATFADVQVTELMADLVSRTNQLGGVLSGQVIIKEGQGTQGLPWTGEGNAQIRDGVLWGLPLFGLLSPVFNAIAPGMGEAQFNAGNAFFTLTNNVVDFSKVELLSSAMRIDMEGTVSFDGEINLVLEARPLRGVPVLGAVLDFVLAPFTKLFEYEVRGTLGDPRADLKNVPSFLLAPLRPFQTLKSIFGGSKDKPGAKPEAGPGEPVPPRP